MTGRVIAVGRNASTGSAPSVGDLGRIDAVSGACVLVTRASVEDVGLMTEDYLMEDLDWGRRRESTASASQAKLSSATSEERPSECRCPRESFASFHLSVCPQRRSLCSALCGMALDLPFRGRTADRNAKRAQRLLVGWQSRLRGFAGRCKGQERAAGCRARAATVRLIARRSPSRFKPTSQI